MGLNYTGFFGCSNKLINANDCLGIDGFKQALAASPNQGAMTLLIIIIKYKL
jgi:hypothetical protein